MVTGETSEGRARGHLREKCRTTRHSYRRDVDETVERTPFPAWALRLALAGFVALWIFGPYELRSSVPIWIPFAVALGLELQFLWSAFRQPGARRLDRRPQAGDRERFGYDEHGSELLLVREEDRELWIPYSGETDEELDELIADAREWAAEEELPSAPAPPASRGLWPPVRRFLTGLAIVTVLGLAVWFVEARTGWSSVSGEERAAAVERFSTEASRIAGKPVSIGCDEARDYVGFVQHADGVALVGGDRAYLTPEICHDLYRLAFEGEVDSSRTGRALAVLAHEAWHLRGEAVEARAECFALQSGVDLGRSLGLSDDRAHQLMRQQLTENALRAGATVEYRVPPECRDGSSLDLRPHDARFP
jgi:hypothetical protein